MGKQYVKG